MPDPETSIPSSAVVRAEIVMLEQRLRWARTQLKLSEEHEAAHAPLVPLQSACAHLVDAAQLVMGGRQANATETQNGKETS